MRARGSSRRVLDSLRNRLMLRVGRLRRARRCSLRRSSVDAVLHGRCARYAASRVRASRCVVALARRGVPVPWSPFRRAGVAARARRRARPLGARRPPAVVRISACVVFRGRRWPGVRHEPRPLSCRVGIAAVPETPPRRFGLGAVRVSDTKPRNFSNWAYWRLHLERVVPDDPCPLDDLASGLDAWRERIRSRLDALLGPRPESVDLAVETTDEVDCGEYARRRL